MTIPAIVMFDLDKTLTRSKAVITPAMARLLTDLLARTNVGIISGGKLEQFMAQIVEQLPAGAHLDALYLLPTSGAMLLNHREGAWKTIYQELLDPDETVVILEAMMDGAKEANVIDFDSPAYGERMEVRGAQVTLSALGQQAPVGEKEVWDEDGAKRDALRAAIAKRLPHYDVKRGGATSIDVTKHGINKAYGVRQLSVFLHTPIEDMLYIGDALYPGGNDEVVKETGIPTLQVAEPDVTEEAITALLQAK